MTERRDGSGVVPPSRLPTGHREAWLEKRGLRVVPPPPPAPATVRPLDSPETRLFRSLQRVIEALTGDDEPTPRVRAGLRDAAHQAIDAYFVERLAARVSAKREQSRQE